jgi:hypothetical protein
MINKFIPIATAVAFVLAASGVQSQEFSSLEERMTGREFRDAGLHKLTEEELAALNRWIEMRSLAEGEVPAWAAGAATVTAPGVTAEGSAATDMRGLDRGDRTEINSRIVGSFSGWSGDDVFELENGMVWEQAESGTFSVATIENPEVRIRPGFFGSWQLQVEGYNRRIRVERVR